MHWNVQKHLHRSWPDEFDASEAKRAMLLKYVRMGNELLFSNMNAKWIMGLIITGQNLYKHHKNSSSSNDGVDRSIEG